MDAIGYLMDRIDSELSIRFNTDLCIFFGSIVVHGEQIAVATGDTPAIVLEILYKRCNEYLKEDVKANG